jgi:L-iditol 2-dehydrogenase
VKAVVVAEPGRFAVREVPAPTPAAGQALVRVKASTVCGTDQKIFAGLFPGTRFPHIPGHEFAGEVVEVAAGVDQVQPGDRVGVEVHVGCGACARCLEGLYQLCLNYGRTETGHAHIGFTVAGGLAEYAVVAARALHKLPPSLSWEEGAFCDNIGIVLYALERGQLRAGERVVVLGAGAFGALAAQAARALGAARVVLVGTRAERMDRLAGMADALVVVSREADGAAGGAGGATGDGPDAAAILKIRAALGSDGADLVVEFAGTAEAARQAIQLARRGGRVVLAGSTGPGRELSGVDLSTIVRGHLDIYGSLANPRGISGRGLELIARGAVDVKPLVTHCFPLEQFPEAWATFVERRDGAIRVILQP